MKKWLFLIWLLPALSLAQENDHFTKKNKVQKKFVPNTRSTEIGIFGGASFYNGDINPAKQLNPALSHWALGALIRRNLSSRWALRLNGMYGIVKGDDFTSNSIFQQQRGVTFQSKIYELSGQAEFNFFPYCVANDIIYATPYLFWGLGVFHFNPTTGSDNQKLSTLQTEGEKYAKTTAAMPFGFGIKAKFSNRFLFAAEWGIRKTWTDYIDDVSTIYATSGRQRGNSQINDYYTFTGITLTIRLGPKITTCHFNQG